MPQSSNKGLFRAFWDWFVLFSGISTASNLSRTRPDPVQQRGLFLFRRSNAAVPLRVRLSPGLCKLSLCR